MGYTPISVKDQRLLDRGRNQASQIEKNGISQYPSHSSYPWKMSIVSNGASEANTANLSEASLLTASTDSDLGQKYLQFKKVQTLDERSASICSKETIFRSTFCDFQCHAIG